jgi:hypothetical protein
MEIQVGQRWNSKNMVHYLIVTRIVSQDEIYYKYYHCRDNGKIEYCMDCGPLTVNTLLWWGQLSESIVETMTDAPQVGDTLKPKVISQCKHENKKIVAMLHTSFWYCPDCKSDLGNA